MVIIAGFSSFSGPSEFHRDWLHGNDRTQARFLPTVSVVGTANLPRFTARVGSSLASDTHVLRFPLARKRAPYPSYVAGPLSDKKAWGLSLATNSGDRHLNYWLETDRPIRQ